jgi:low affinity Fe/Cu permease
MLAIFVIVVWGVSGPVFHFSDTWQLIINTGTTIVTFLMVFLIQSSQNRDGRAIQLKLDELIRSVEGAHNAVISLEDLSEVDLRRVQEEYARLAEKAREEAQNGRGDTDTPIINVPVDKPPTPTLEANKNS